MRDYEEYDLPDQRDVENAVSVILEKVEIAKRNKGKISTETEKAVAVLKQLLKKSKRWNQSLSLQNMNLKSLMTDPRAIEDLQERISPKS